jgi:F0F1-type ATP synthase epsilon subunit
MTNDIQVVASYKASNLSGMEITQVYLKTEEGEITLTKEHWDEIKKTMDGKRKSGHSEEFDGYYPKTASFWN